MRRSIRRTATFLVAVLATMAGSLSPASAATTTVPANADSFVLSASPNANRGGATSLKIRNNIKIAYLRFNVPGLSGGETISTATLRVYATTPSRCTLGVEVLRAANDTWGETTITWGNQPGPTGPVLVSATWTTTGYRNLDVTAAVTTAGPVSFLLRHAVGCNVTSDVGINSREAAANQPQLVVETTGGPPPPPAACSDLIDNDSDGFTDYPADPGCTGPADTDETDPAPGRVVAAAGDIVCDPAAPEFNGAQPASCQHRATAALLTGADAVLPVGDLQYDSGTLARFMAGYDPSWGQFAPTTYPAVGNHEYQVAGAQGYFDYWASKGRPTGGAGAGYYSFDLGSWHLISLNSNCAAVACIEGTAQNNFLEQDLATTTKPCTLAYWHHPLFSSRTARGGAPLPGPKAFWDDLYAAGADIVLNGHEHNYQRYAKQEPAGQAASNGIREFVVGAGGKSTDGLNGPKDPDFQFGQGTDFGVLKLRLGAGSYTWEFVAVNGTVLDAGGPIACN